MLGEDENGQTQNLDIEADFLVVDVSDAILSEQHPILREYDASHDGILDIRPFNMVFPEGVPETVSLAEEAIKWASGAEVSRVSFYSAREEPPAKATPVTKLKISGAKKMSNAALAEKVDQLAAQVALLATSQASAQAQDIPVTPARGLSATVKATPKMPALSQSLASRSSADDAGLSSDQRGGPACRVTRCFGGPQSEWQQWKRLPKHFYKRRAKARENANGAGYFWIQFQQQLHRKMFPSRPVPKNDAEVKAAEVSFLTYLERFGGYKQSKELGTVIWILGQAVDAASQEDFHRTKEVLALLTCAIEQAGLDQGWQNAFLISLSGDPPLAMFQDRMAAMGGSRPFSPLIPSGWAAVALAYLKELEVLQSKKLEVEKPVKRSPKADPSKASPDSPSPKRRPRCPKRPKAESPAGGST